MATEQEIKTLLDGRKIVDAYVLAKTDRTDPHWVHPSVIEYEKSFEELSFKNSNEFFLYDSKLSYQEIADCIDIVSPNDDSIKNPMCDNCIGRLPAACGEVVKLAANSPTSCIEIRQNISVLASSSNSEYADKKATQVLPGGDPVFNAYRDKASLLGLDKIPLGTLDDIVMFWNYPGHFAPRCTLTVKTVREFDFDPFWRLKEKCLPFVNIPASIEDIG
jgi:hypothetical protein